MVIIGQLLMVSVAIRLALCLSLIYQASADWPFYLARNPACGLWGLPVSERVDAWLPCGRKKALTSFEEGSCVVEMQTPSFPPPVLPWFYLGDLRYWRCEKQKRDSVLVDKQTTVQ